MTNLPKSYESMFQNAVKLVEAGEYEQAKSILMRIIGRLETLSSATLAQRQDLMAIAAEAGQRLFLLLAREQNFDEMIALEQRLVKFSGNPEEAAERQIAIIKMQQGHTEEAEATITALTERYPNNQDHWQALAIVRWQNKDFQDAENAFKQMLAINEATGESTVSVWYNLFQLYADQKLTEAAANAWDNGITALGKEGAADYSKLYNYLLSVGDISRLRRYLDNDPSLLRAEYYRGIIARKAGDFVESKQIWERLLQMNPFEYPGGQLEYAEAALRSGDFKRALAVLTADFPDLDITRRPFLLAVAAAAAGQLTHAKESLAEINRTARMRLPSRPALGPDEWDLLAALVDNRLVQAELRPYFQLSEEAEPSA